MCISRCQLRRWAFAWGHGMAANAYKVGDCQVMSHCQGGVCQDAARLRRSLLAKSGRQAAPTWLACCHACGLQIIKQPMTLSPQP